MKKICVIDYDAGNTMSVMNALKFLGVEAELTRDRQKLIAADNCIFPGVGAYSDSLKKLDEYNLRDTVHEMIAGDVPFLGICLGMQLLFDYSYENIGSEADETVKGLGILHGEIKGFKMNEGFSLKVPHMGWNSIKLVQKDSRLFKNIPDESYVYFVHSFYLKAADRNEVSSVCNYGIDFDASIERGNLFGCQFHPEKSGDTGLEILKNFCSL